MCKLKNSNSSKFKQLYWFIKYQLMSRHFYAITGPMRILPDFLIIGAKRCGTTSLYYHLPEHPCIAKSHHDSMGFFNDNFHLGLNWYRSFFPTNFYKKSLKSKFQKLLAFDVTTGYIEKEFTADNIYQTKPDMKIISILRNPVDRAYSQYHLDVREKVETRSFEQAITEEIDELKRKDLASHNNADRRFLSGKSNYLKKGLYALQLKYWFKIFPRENLLILSTEEFESNQQAVYNKIFKFLDISSFEVKDTKKMRKANYVKMNNKTRQTLLEFFRPQNEELFQMINIRFEWTN